MTAYALGVDLGTTYTAAAIGRGGTATTLTLGTDTAAVPSVVVVRDDGEVLVGDAAERRAGTEPARSAREFKRRLGDPVPIVIGDQPHTIESLMAHQLRDVLARATSQEGEAPSVVVLTHPANYTDFKLGKLREVADLAGVDPATLVLLPEPEAAAVTYTQSQRVEPGEVIAVYDFGGGTFDAALLRRATDGFELLGVPEGMERLGGIDFDQAVLAHVDTAVGGLVSGADRSDPQTLPALARLRTEARRGKEALSTDGDTSIPIALPGLNTEVRLTRAELEEMVRPRIAQTVAALERTVASAGLTMDGVSRILLVGGTSRMPVVSELVASATGRPVSVDTHPKLAIANGAALAGAATLTGGDPDPTAPAWQAPTRVAPPGETGRRVHPGLVVAVVVAAIALVTVGAVVLFGGSDDDPAATDPADTATVGSTSPDATSPDASPAGTDPAGTDTAGSAPAGTEPGVVPPPTDPAATDPAEPVPPATDPAGPVTVAELDADATAMGLGENGDVIVLTVAQQLVAVGADGTVTVLLDAVPERGAVGGVAEGLDGDYLATTADGVVDLESGDVVLAAGDGGLGSTPGPIALDGVGSAYVADADNSRVIRRAPDGALSLVAGNGEPGTGGPIPDGTPAVDAAIGPVGGLGIDGDGRLLIVETASGRVLVVVADGTVSTSATTVPAGSTPATVDRDGAVWWVDGTSVQRAAPS
jgi:actin-like ATPase involved in cell morphogenesis